MLRKVISDNLIPQHRPVILDGWDETNRCFKVAVPSKITDRIRGITLLEIPATTVVVDYIITTGTVDHMDTSSWSQGEIIYATTSGTLSNTVDIPQEVAIVRKSHATLGRLLLLDDQNTNTVSGAPWYETTVISSTTNTYTLTYSALEKSVFVLLDGFPMQPTNYTLNKTGSYVTSITFNDNLFNGNTLTVWYARV